MATLWKVVAKDGVNVAISSGLLIKVPALKKAVVDLLPAVKSLCDP